MEHSSLTSDPSSQRDINDIKPVFSHGDSKPTLQDIKDINTNAPQQDSKEIKPEQYIKQENIKPLFTEKDATPTCKQEHVMSEEYMMVGDHNSQAEAGELQIQISNVRSLSQVEQVSNPDTDVDVPVGSSTSVYSIQAETNVASSDLGYGKLFIANYISKRVIIVQHLHFYLCTWHWCDRRRKIIICIINNITTLPNTYSNPKCAHSKIFVYAYIEMKSATETLLFTLSNKMLLVSN